MYIQRHLQEAFERASKFFPALLLTGPRQVGKTTFLRHIAESGRKYVTLDDMQLRSLAQEDPRAFLQKFHPPVLIDEIQYAPQLLPCLKMAIDEQRFREPEKAAGMYWLTGSQRFQLMQGVSESLAGRIGIFEMSGLSQSEMVPRRNLRFRPDCIREQGPERDTGSLFHRIWAGSLPEVFQASTENRELFYSSYVTTYLERDIRSLTEVHDLEKFYKFLCSCAARTGQLLNCCELGRDAGVNNVTASNWLSLLLSSRLIYLLQPYTGSLTSRLVKTPKLYFLDTGLAAYLTRWPTPETLESGAMNGAFFETWCLAEILKTYWNDGAADPKLFFYRDKDKKEIDLLLESADGLHPVEFKKNSLPKTEDVKHFSVLKHLQVPVGKGALICNCPEPVPLPGRDVICLPASWI